jgi:hypothetical protein
LAIAKRKSGASGVLWLFLLITSIGCLLGNLAYFKLPSPPFRAWHFWAKPPSQAIKLLLPREYDTVFVQSIDGNTYTCESGNRCEQAKELPGANFFRYSDAPNSLTPILPGKVVDSLKYRAWGIDSYVDIHLAILDDGTIWEWRNNQGALLSDGPKILTYSLIGVLLGALLGFVIYRTMQPKLK